MHAIVTIATCVHCHTAVVKDILLFYTWDRLHAMYLYIQCMMQRYIFTKVYVHHSIHAHSASNVVAHMC